jgi:hypothetical protein
VHAPPHLKYKKKQITQASLLLLLLSLLQT